MESRFLTERNSKNAIYLCLIASFQLICVRAKCFIRDLTIILDILQFDKTALSSLIY